jgi:hypothetical protein
MSRFDDGLIYDYRKAGYEDAKLFKYHDSHAMRAHADLYDAYKVGWNAWHDGVYVGKER